MVNACAEAQADLTPWPGTTSVSICTTATAAAAGVTVWFGSGSAYATYAPPGGSGTIKYDTDETAANHIAFTVTNGGTEAGCGMAEAETTTPLGGTSARVAKGWNQDLTCPGSSAQEWPVEEGQIDPQTLKELQEAVLAKFESRWLSEFDQLTTEKEASGRPLSQIGKDLLTQMKMDLVGQLNLSQDLHIWYERSPSQS